MGLTSDKIADIARIGRINSTIAASHLMNGSVELTNTVIQLAYDGVLYVGNGTTQNIVTGLSTIDFTNVSNGTGFYHDRVAGDGIIKNDAGAIIESGSIAFMDVAGVDGVCDVRVKDRSANNSNTLADGLRGISKEIYTNGTNVEATTIQGLTAFGLNGFSVGNTPWLNTNSNNYIAYVNLYTHIAWGLTNQGKRYLVAYNPVTNKCLALYQGSGLAGHEIPHFVGSKLSFTNVKSLLTAVNWGTHYGEDTTNHRGYINLVNALTSAELVEHTLNNVSMTSNTDYNALDGSYILYGKAHSTTWGLHTYVGTSATDNFVETLDVNGVARKPARVIIKAVSAVSNWTVYDNRRADDGHRLFLNVSDAEDTVSNRMDFISNGFNILNTFSDMNASGVQYIALVEYDTNSDGGGSYFDSPTATTQVQVTGNLSFSESYDENGAKNTTQAINRTLSPTNGWQ